MTSDERGSKFDRIKRPERRLLERPEGERLEEAPTADGRAALFTHGRPIGDDTAAVAVHCSRCGASTALGTAAAVRSLVPLFLVAPWRDHPLFAVCPACRHRAWLRPNRPR
jgi:hypothetical protein